MAFCGKPRTSAAAACPLAVLTLLAGLPSIAAADLTPIGATLTGVPAPGSPIVNLGDIAFDDKHNVYLHVWGIGPHVHGQFVDPNGALVGGSFQISFVDLQFGVSPRVAYSAYTSDDVFFVAFSSDANGLAPDAKNVFGQLVRFDGGGPDLVGGNFPISEQSSNRQIFQTAGGVTYNPGRREFFVTWEDSRGSFEAFGRRFDVNGTPVSNDINISASPQIDGTPDVAFDWQTNRYLVTYRFEVANIPGTAAKILSDTGTILTSMINVSFGGVQSEPSALYLPEAGEFLVTWTDLQLAPGGGFVGGGDVSGRRIDPNGAFASAIYPVVAHPTLFDGAPDGRYNPTTRTTLVAAANDSKFIWGSELDAFGQPLSLFQVSNIQGISSGTWTPRVAAGANGQFAVAFIRDFASVWVERLQGLVPLTPGPEPGNPIPPPVSAEIDLSGAGAPNGSWFFAEGTTGGQLGFDTYYLITNEHDVPVSVRAYLARSDSFTTERTFTIQPRTRHTLRLGNEVGPGAYGAVFQSLTAGRQIYVERASFWLQFQGGASARGAMALSTSWFFAEGSRLNEFFENFFLVFNPSSTGTAQVTVTFRRPGGAAPVVRQLEIPPQARLTLDTLTIPELANTDFSAQIDSNIGVAAERSMFWNSFASGTASFGTPQTAPAWFFAEGVAFQAFDTFFTILNPNPADVDVDATYLLDSGAPIAVAHTVPANSRHTIWLTAEVGLAGGVGAQFRSRGGENFVTERSVYWGTGWVEGTNVVGATAAAPTWRLPEGTTQADFETFLLLTNPNAFDVLVRITSTLGNGGQTTNDITVPATRRLTVYMNDPAQFPFHVNQSFATRVDVLTAQGTVIAEHAIYWKRAPDFTNDFWLGGSASFGIPGGAP